MLYIIYSRVLNARYFLHVIDPLYRNNNNEDFFGLSRRCPLLATFLPVIFCLLSLLISERFSGLVSFGSVYLVTTAGFVADQLM